MPTQLTPGKLVLSLVALVTSTGCYIADWSATHVLNPSWPPHAKFHNGQTMSMGLLLGLSSLYYTWRPTRAPRDSLFTAALLASLYWITGLSAILYPGTLWVDPEFGEGAPQRVPFAVLAALAWVGYAVDRGSLGEGDGEGKGKGKGKRG